MPTFPRLAKLWQPPVIVALPQQGTTALQHGKAVVAMKNAFLAPTMNPWVMKACSDSVSTSTSSDLIVDETDIVPATSGAHTWFVLRNPVTGQQFCVDFNAANNQSLTTYMSVAAGFTGGSTSARPTATDEVSTGATNIWFMGANVGRCKLFLMHSTDGKVTYGFIMYQGIIMSAWLFGEMTSHHTSWTPPYIGVVQGSNALTTTGLNTWLRFHQSGDFILARAASGAMLMRTTDPYSHGRLSDTEATRESPTGNWQFWPYSLVCINSPRRGRHGILLDIFRVPASEPVGWIYRSDDGEQALMTIGAGNAVPWHPDYGPQVF